MDNDRIANLVLVLVSTAVSVALLEFACRVALPPPGFAALAGDYVPGLFVPHPERGFAYRPGFTGQQTSSDYDVTFTIDERGFRVADDGRTPPRERQILAVGDSFTTGLGVTFEEAWPHQLERLLGEGTDSGVQVLNAGVDGYGLQQIREFTEALIPLIQPDLVIAGVYVAAHGRVSNPYVLAGDYLMRAEMTERVEFEHGGYLYSVFERPWLVQLDLWLNRHFYVAAHALHGLHYLGVRVARLGDDEVRHAEVKEELAPFLAELLALRQAIESQNVPLVVLLIGTQGRDGGPTAATLRNHDIVRTFCDEQGLTCVDTAQALVDAQNGGLLVRFPNDAHWNATGHRLAAQLLAVDIRVSWPGKR